MEKCVLVAHHDPIWLERLTLRLHDRGYHVLGPARTAKMALALAAQARPTLAMIGERLAGQRDGRALARALRETWGVRSFIVKDKATSGPGAKSSTP